MTVHTPMTVRGGRHHEDEACTNRSWRQRAGRPQSASALATAAWHLQLGASWACCDPTPSVPRGFTGLDVYARASLILVYPTSHRLRAPGQPFILFPALQRFHFLRHAHRVLRIALVYLQGEVRRFPRWQRRRQGYSQLAAGRLSWGRSHTRDPADRTYLFCSQFQWIGCQLRVPSVRSTTRYAQQCHQNARSRDGGAQPLR
ncbi:hypothetical protein PsYK624_081100 [Phanerochaete sordida]|uniref:Uncharacterized protein n=1 Tax=Phanerochaete sordida TaxID=48140 RepID=A0A9P3GBQ9_9APHY|nr:hypothetical protein PsYK624_081100 [Phanerochaete sordida]